MVAGEQTITYWDSALPTQPTSDQLAAVTQAQVSAAQEAAITAAGGNALANATDPNAVGTRAAVTQLYTRVNDLAEGFRAALELICQVANITMPTAAQIQSQIASDRTTTPVDAGATDAGTVSTTFNVRIDQTTILAAIQATLAAGGGLPTGD